MFLLHFAFASAYQHTMQSVDTQRRKKDLEISALQTKLHTVEIQLDEQVSLGQHLRSTAKVAIDQQHQTVVAHSLEVRDCAAALGSGITHARRLFNPIKHGPRIACHAHHSLTRGVITLKDGTMSRHVLYMIEDVIAMVVTLNVHCDAQQSALKELRQRLDRETYLRQEAERNLRLVQVKLVDAQQAAGRSGKGRGKANPTAPATAATAASSSTTPLAHTRRGNCQCHQAMSCQCCTNGRSGPLSAVVVRANPSLAKAPCPHDRQAASGRPTHSSGIPAAAWT